ncbi:regulatory protein RecX [Candidatus Omnitrophota bacterium]
MPASTAAELVRAKRLVYQLLKFRNRSKKEIVDRLKRKKYSTNTIQKIIEHFQDLDYINDDQFATSWVQARIANLQGPRRIFFELKQKGIKEELIKETWGRVKKDYNEFEVARGFARDKLITMGKLDKRKVKARIYGYLNRRGFSTAVIYEVMQTL